MNTGTLFKNLFFLALFFFSIELTANNAAIIIRPAIASDLLSALELDCRACIDAFKPIFETKYADIIISQDADYYLSLDIKNDIALFHDCIEQKCAEKLFVAFDQSANRVIGLIVFHQESERLMEIDLLLVDKEYRRNRIGKRLIHAAREYYNALPECGVYVFSHNKEALSFYQSQGFIIIGPGPQNKITPYGLSYAELYVYCKCAA